jgi:protease-4
MKTKIVLTFVLLASFTFSGAALPDFFSSQSGDAAVIQLNGPIQPTQATGLTATSGITPSQVRSLNHQAESQGVDAIVYEINSGGGAVVASKEVKRAIEDVEVPTVCRFRDTAASGAYLFSMGCDEIVADSATITGSIGVRASYLEFSGLMEKYGITYVNVTAGESKGVGSQFSEPTGEEKQQLKERVEVVHEDFKNQVQEGRNLSESEIEDIATGEIFLGEQAKELGLVDKLGGRETAYETAENLTEKELNFVSVESRQQFNPFSLLISAFLPDFNLNNQGSVLRAEFP